MKTAAIIGAFASVAFSATALAQQDAPSPIKPDYTIVMQTLDRDGRQIDPVVTIAHHDGIVLSKMTSKGITSIGFGPDEKEPFLRWSRAADGQITALELPTPRQKSDTDGGETRLLGTTSIVAGENCRWREAVSKLFEQFKSREQTCLTEDGIIIERKLLGSDDFEMYHSRMTSLDRGTISPADMRPPADMLTADFWLRPLRDHPADPSLADFEITLESPRKSRIRLLRHYPWNYREERDDAIDALRVTIWNELESQGIDYLQNHDDRYLRASRLQHHGPDMAFDLTTGKVSEGKTDTVLGETCEWFDLLPDVSDASKHRCLTQDGLVLKEENSRRNFGGSYTATSFLRRPVALSEMRLPQQAFSPGEWGLPTPYLP